MTVMPNASTSNLQTFTAGEETFVDVEHVERQLTELNEKLDTKIGDHDSILTNHAERIAKLEQNKIS